MGDVYWEPGGDTAATLLLLISLLQPSYAQLEATWAGKVDDLHTVLLMITNSGGSVSGRVVFSSQADHSTATLKLSDVTIEGNKLSFKLPQLPRPGESRPPELFEFVRTSPTQGRLTGFRASERIEIVLTRTKWTESRYF